MTRAKSFSNRRKNNRAFRGKQVVSRGTVADSEIFCGICLVSLAAGRALSVPHGTVRRETVRSMFHVERSVHSRTQTKLPVSFHVKRPRGSELRVQCSTWNMNPCCEGGFE